MVVPLVLLLATAVANGCSGSSSPGKTVSGWFGGGSEAGAKGERVYYSTIDGLEVRAQPDASSKVVGRLRIHEKVVRAKEKGGYGFVRARGSNLEGWVLNSRLDWRTPGKAGGARPGAGAADESVPADDTAPVAGDESVDAVPEQVAPDVVPAELEPAAPTPAPLPEPAAPAPTRKKGVGASVLDPY